MENISGFNVHQILVRCILIIKDFSPRFFLPLLTLIINTSQSMLGRSAEKATEVFFALPMLILNERALQRL